MRGTRAGVRYDAFSPANSHNVSVPEPARPPRRLRWVVPVLGVAQIISWGSLYYPIAVLGAAIRRDLAISDIAVFGSASAQSPINLAAVTNYYLGTIQMQNGSIARTKSSPSRASPATGRTLMSACRSQVRPIVS